MNTHVDVVPTNANDGRSVTVREIVILLGNDLMRTDGMRVVSAWRHMPAVKPRLQERLDGGSVYERFCEGLRARVHRDIGAAQADAGFDAYWIYAPYIELCRYFGGQWPVEALAAYLRIFKWSEVTAQSVWERAVDRYDNFKFADGEPWAA
jgi:hypothetical protein